MIILIPLGGSGERFKNSGYNLPKALINVFGKPILYYLLDRLNLTNVSTVYIPYNEEYTKYRFEEKLHYDFPEIPFKFYKLENMTRGAAETIKISLEKMMKEDYYDCPILCLDADNFYTIDVVKIWDKRNNIMSTIDTGTSPIYSYIRINNGLVSGIEEKTKISSIACTGAYGFESWKQLYMGCRTFLLKEEKEYYTSGVIRGMIERGIPFKNTIIERKDWTCLGTPLQLLQFYHNYPKVSCLDNTNNISKKRICFDLDNTLVTYPKIKGDYTTVEPIQENINLLRYLKSFGHEIIIYTARKMKTHNSNLGKVTADIGKLTFDTLEKFGIVYDEIYFGKPQADIYIDDLAVNAFDNIEKMIGFYHQKISPRNFNEIEMGSMDIYVKKSEDLSGEIYWYTHIPNCVKDLFPIFIDYFEDNTTYRMEKINGVTVSFLYINESLTETTLLHIMNSIKRIQSSKTEHENINIYANYADKIEKRYNGYSGYKKFKGSEEIYLNLMGALKQYENSNKGRMTIIHGDPVMTNIIINSSDKIKFIDMRGKIGNDLSIYGDWLYDWAKLYQSLIGYDKILMNKTISRGYEKKMINFFEENFTTFFSEEDLDNMKLVTQSLLFSLIPLHDDEKCLDYYSLMVSLCPTHLSHD